MEPPGPRLTLWLVRALTLLLLPAVLTQPVLAGLYLSGEWDALGLHSALLFVAVVMQAGFGYARQLGLHIPLGVAVVTGTVLFTIWLCRRGARIPRGARRGAR